jgi:hypothetical protein
MLDFRFLDQAIVGSVTSPHNAPMVTGHRQSNPDDPAGRGGKLAAF